MRILSIFSFDTLRVPATFVWPWVIVLSLVILAEVTLRVGVADYLPDPDKWRDPGVEAIVQDYRAALERHGRVDVLVLGSSQGATWIDAEAISRTFNISVVNASLPGGNLEVSEFLLERLLLPAGPPPRVVAVTVGPVNLGTFNEGWLERFKQGPYGSRQPSPITQWLNQNVYLVKYGGQTINRSFLKELRKKLGYAKPQPDKQRPEKRHIATEAEFNRKLKYHESLRLSQQQFDALERLSHPPGDTYASVVINMPYHPRARKAVRWEHEGYLRRVRSAIGATPFLDVNPIAQPEHFTDPVHTDYIGRRALMQPVGEVLKIQLRRTK